MADIYDQHKAAFANVSAYVVMQGGSRVATIAFKYPRDGAGRLYAYVHFIGLEMTRGYAGGCGYDKHSAACADAARKTKGGNAPKGTQLNADKFVAALLVDDGNYWHRNLEEAGFAVWQAV